ncbi:MAG: tRNA-dihydrouridine synthase family protein [Deltaproteobacteria bacterium]|nr:tRNA-dihydrouridine synthase family protein [Deltaproteobacteria bacterium]
MIYLAPLQGTTDRIYRTLFPLYFKGVDLAIAPFISPMKKMKADHRLLKEVDPHENKGIPTIPQIMTAHPGDFVTLANRLYDMGCATVNWNIGCPFPMVVKKGRGAGILCYPERVAAFLEEAVPALKPALSIKLRIGTAYPDEVFALLPIFDRFSLEELIIHPRTGKQMYEGEVDIDTFGESLKVTKHRVVYNGDIDSAEKLAQLAKRFGSIDRWMIGRGLLGNPFLAEEIKFATEKPYPEKVRILRAFHDHLFAEYAQVLCGPAHIVNKMKEIWTYLGSFLDKRDKILKKINKTHHRDNYLDVVNRAFDELEK